MRPTVSDRSPSSEPLEPAESTSEPALVCPRCGTVAKPADVFCEVDGFRLPDPATAAPMTGLLDHEEQELAPDLAATTDRGRHHARNEDAFALARTDKNGEPVTIVVVCDGVSSSHDPQQASGLVARLVRDELVVAVAREAFAAPGALAEAILNAHLAACAQLFELVDGEDPPGTTVVAAIAALGQVTVGWVGDSRAYWLSADASQASLLTHDHSWVNEVVERGELSEAEALRSPWAHALTHCLGPLEQLDSAVPPQPGIATFEPPAGCRLIVCSDGLWNYLPQADQIAQQVRELPAEASALAVSRALVDYALDQGGQDNITVAVAFLS